MSAADSIYDCLSFLQPEQADVLPVFGLRLQHPEYYGYTLVRNPEKPLVCMFLLLRRLPKNKIDDARSYELFGFEDVPLTLVKTFIALRRKPCAKSNTFVVGQGDYSIFVNKLLFSTYKLHRFPLSSPGSIYGKTYHFLRMDSLVFSYENILNRTFFRKVNIVEIYKRRYHTRDMYIQPKNLKNCVTFADDASHNIAMANHYILASGDAAQYASAWTLDDTFLNTSYAKCRKHIGSRSPEHTAVPKDMNMKEVWSKKHNLPTNIFKTLKAQGFELISLK